MPGIDEPPLEPPADGSPPPLEPPLFPPGRLLEEPPDEPPPLEPEEPPDDPDEPPELGEEGMDVEEDCWLAQPPIRKAETEPMARQ